MFDFFKPKSASSPRSSGFDASREIAAISASHILSRFSLDGIILEVNPRFCDFVGLRAEDLIGKPHEILLRDKDKTDPQILTLWATMRAGKYVERIVPRVNQAGDEVWLDITYAPVLGKDGKPDHVVVLASDITAMHLRRRDNRSQVDAVKRSLAVIEFDLDGTILDANDLFLQATGYSIEQLRGKHHRIFMPTGEADTEAYRTLWDRLRAGTSETGQVRRVDAHGRDIWLEAAYETLIDPEGRPFKVVKYAFDITEAKNLAADAASQIEAIQKVQAVIEFDTKGTILGANDVFCRAMGYDASEIVGKHHSLFMPPNEIDTPSYKVFWENLSNGQELFGEFQRLAKGGRPVFLSASYNPIRDAAGKVVKVVKFAVDNTELRLTVNSLSDALSRAARGDLSVQITQDLGKFDQIRQTFNDTLSKLHDVITQIGDRTAQVQTEAVAIMAATDDLARRTETQAATLEQSSAALEEMSVAVRQSSDTSQSARNNANDAKRKAENSARIVGDAVKAMAELEDSSQKISKITGVIDEIAFQTNLLALNAGVEAARAGEEGRGFAVVASEVRSLAQRSSDAAQEIADLISASVRLVKRGVELVENVGTAITEVDHMVGDISGSIASIANSAQEQSSGISEMNTSISQLDRATQQNAAMAEETNAAIRTLNGGITETQDLLRFFQGSSQDAPVVASASARLKAS